MDGKWEYQGHLFQSVEPVFVLSLQGWYDVWFDVTDQHPSAKQIAAWTEFYNLSSNGLREQFLLGLANFENRINMHFKNSRLESGSSYSPKAIKELLQKAISSLQNSALPLGKHDLTAFRCQSLVIPLQEKSPAYFVVMHFELGAGTNPDYSFGYEMEALFCNGQLLFVGEDSGLWTRLEWNYEFNVPDFDSKTAHHTYWRL